jgi:hypothetical protein
VQLLGQSSALRATLFIATESPGIRHGDADNRLTDPHLLK